MSEPSGDSTPSIELGLWRTSIPAYNHLLYKFLLIVHCVRSAYTSRLTLLVAIGLSCCLLYILESTGLSSRGSIRYLTGDMGDQRLNVKTVGVIGAGVSGVATAIHLRKAGLEVKMFERNPHIGGVWYVRPDPLDSQPLLTLSCFAGYSTSANLETLLIRPSCLLSVIRLNTNALGPSVRTVRVAVLLMRKLLRGSLRLWNLRRLGLVMRD
jgi:hypothetical protein